MAVEFAVPHREFGGVAPAAADLGLEHLPVEEVLGENAHLPSPEGGRIKAFVYDLDGIPIRRLHPLHGLVIGDARRNVASVHDGIISKANIPRVEFMVIVKLHPAAQAENNYGIVLGQFYAPEGRLPDLLIETFLEKGRGIPSDGLRAQEIFHLVKQILVDFLERDLHARRDRRW